MKTLRKVFFLSLLITRLYSAGAMDIPAGAIKGDFDGDGKQEYAWIIKPAINDDNTGCVIGDCVAKLIFSNPHLKPIILKNSIGGELTNLGKLNGNAKDVIGLLPDWFQGCWRNFLTYTLKNGKWQYLRAPFPTHCNQWEDNVNPVQKIPEKKGYLKINYSAVEKNEIVVKSKVVKVL